MPPLRVGWGCATGGKPDHPFPGLPVPAVRGPDATARDRGVLRGGAGDSCRAHRAIHRAVVVAASLATTGSRFPRLVQIWKPLSRSGDGRVVCRPHGCLIRGGGTGAGGGWGGVRVTHRSFHCRTPLSRLLKPIGESSGYIHAMTARFGRDEVPDILTASHREQSELSVALIATQHGFRFAARQPFSLCHRSPSRHIMTDPQRRASRGGSAPGPHQRRAVVGGHGSRSQVGVR